VVLSLSLLSSPPSPSRDASKDTSMGIPVPARPSDDDDNDDDDSFFPPTTPTPVAGVVEESEDKR